MRYKPLDVELKTGDYIAIAYNNRFVLGIFKKYGVHGNIQYYNVPREVIGVKQVEEWLKNNNGERFYPGYINTDAAHRVIKIDNFNLPKKNWDIIFVYKQLLQKYNKL